MSDGCIFRVSFWRVFLIWLKIKIVLVILNVFVILGRRFCEYLCFKILEDCMFVYFLSFLYGDMINWFELCLFCLIFFCNDIFIWLCVCVFLLGVSLI